MVTGESSFLSYGRGQYVWFNKVIPEIRDIYLASKYSVCEGVGYVKAKTVSTKYDNPIKLTITNIHRERILPIKLSELILLSPVTNLTFLGLVTTPEIHLGVLQVL
ncbi:hypothetical protein HNY73_005689 [Argiope bruennichi]|uniref:Uncharacterized protein n=1 Tax=Argiope bruennichi TaxID=94029 RepID=A0A8T0FMB6_ARGBR|nr:hypothetical protein HNY73_005689 [Argiope bruennichi]